MIDILVPTYMDFRVIRTVKSILLNKFSNRFRIIIIDGQERSCSVASKSLLKLLRPCDIYLYGPDGGVWDALNKGLSVSDNEVVGWLGSDDFFSKNLSPKSIETEIIDKGYDAVIFGTAFYSTVKITRGFPPPKLPYQIGGAIPHYSSFWSRKFIGKDSFDEGLVYSSDLDFFFRQIVVKNARFYRDNSLITYMQVGGITTKSWRSVISQNIECFGVYRRYLPWYRGWLAILFKGVTKYISSKKYQDGPIIDELTTIIMEDA